MPNSYRERGLTAVRQSPNLALSIFLYSAGMLLILMAGVMMVQAFGWVKSVPESVIWALVLLAIGGGILMGLRKRY